jgi:hypothetical protein
MIIKADTSLIFLLYVELREDFLMFLLRGK